MESCFSGFAFPSLCSGIKPKCDQTKPQTMSIYKGKSAAHALYWSFVCFLCRTSNSSLCLCMHPYVCLWLNVCVFVSICLGRREGAKMKGEDWSGAVLVLAGWWGGKCQKASLDSREEAVNSSSPGNLSVSLLSQSYPPIYSPVQLAPAHLYNEEQSLLFVPHFL